MVSLPALVEGGIAVAIATVTGGFLVEDVGEAAVPRSAFYSTPQEAEARPSPRSGSMKIGPPRAGCGS